MAHPTGIGFDPESVTIRLSGLSGYWQGAALAPSFRSALSSSWTSLLEIGAIRAKEKLSLEVRSFRALDQLAAAQAKYQAASDSDPSLRFVALLKLALDSGHGHLANRQGRMPEQPERRGWRQEPDHGWVAVGARIGWIEGEQVYLEPSISYRVAQELAGTERIPIGEQTLRQRLNERGLLASIDQKRETLKVRRMIEGEHREVLHLKASALAGTGQGEPDRQPDRSWR